MKQYKIRESYSYSALNAAALILRNYTNWTFTVKRKDNTMNYHELYAELKEDNIYKNLSISEAVSKNELERIRFEAHTFVDGYQWGYQQGQEDKQKGE